MFNLTINSTNVANSLNNMYQYQFKNDAFEVPANAEMMTTSFILPYTSAASKASKPSEACQQLIDPCRCMKRA
jgi:hypothetical protein